MNWCCCCPLVSEWVSNYQEKVEMRKDRIERWLLRHRDIRDSEPLTVQTRLAPRPLRQIINLTDRLKCMWPCCLDGRVVCDWFVNNAVKQTLWCHSVLSLSDEGCNSRILKSNNMVYWIDVYLVYNSNTQINKNICTCMRTHKHILA